MTRYDLVIRSGTVATAADVTTCDIAVREGRIVALGEDLGPAEEVIDARGMVVTPGGVDAHCHLDQPTSDGARFADDFDSGTVSAAFGGTTTVIPFALQMRGQNLRDVVTDYHAKAAGKAVIDYGFHLILSDLTRPEIMQELPALIAEGYTSFKVYMTYDDMKLSDRDILDVLDLARREGAMTMIHAENTDCIAWLTERMLREGKTAPLYHALSRPAAVEREATHRACTLAEIVGTTALIVHVSAGEAIEQIRAARARGLRILAETCPQYLFLTIDDLGGPGAQGMKCICSPPPRDKANQELVWRALADNTFDILSSDHAPFSFDDAAGKQRRGPDTPFTHVPNGVPGIETRMPLLFSEGVLKGRIGLPRFVALTSANAARIYGLPHKGSLAVGADADIVVWDPECEAMITNGRLHHRADYTPYEGRAVTGWPKVVLSRGSVVCRDGALLARPGQGRFQARSRPLTPAA